MDMKNTEATKGTEMNKNRRNDSQATKDFWAKVNREDRIADLRGEGHSDATIALILDGRACANCGSGNHTVCNR